MHTHIYLLLASLAAQLGMTNPLPDKHTPDPYVCTRDTGVYDVCDTEHSYIKCRGHDAILVVDCKTDPSHYCHIVKGRGHCNGRTPPPMPYGYNSTT
jgi:hypothetical protein